MNEFVMKDFGFTALDPVARCAISGGDSEYGILGELLEDLLEGLASKLGAAAWSCVEKILQEAQRTSAPNIVRVSIRTAVCIVMCRLPVILAPRKGC
jgi:hypothetical protein